jgi:hypothetical protein
MFRDVSLIRFNGKARFPNVPKYHSTKAYRERIRLLPNHKSKWQHINYPLLVFTVPYSLHFESDWMDPRCDGKEVVSNSSLFAATC